MKENVRHSAWNKIQIKGMYILCCNLSFSFFVLLFWFHFFARFESVVGGGHDRYSENSKLEREFFIDGKMMDLLDMKENVRGCIWD